MDGNTENEMEKFASTWGLYPTDLAPDFSGSLVRGTIKYRPQHDVGN